MDNPDIRSKGPSLYDVVVIGGGPAGLFLALQAGRSAHSVLLLEKKPSCGKKLLLSGSGQCNLTHEGPVQEFIPRYGSHGSFLRPALMTWTNQDLVAFFMDHGLAMATDPGGKIFPATRKARDILDILLSECRSAGVRIHCDEPVMSVGVVEGGFLARTARGEYCAGNLVIATGGASYPATGSTGDGFDMARKLGHRVEETAPALTPVYIDGFAFSGLSGISFEMLPIRLFRAGKKVREHTGDVLITHAGLSGPGVLDLSRYIVAGDILEISFLPGMDAAALDRHITGMARVHGNRLVRTCLVETGLPDRFLKAVLALSGVPGDLPAARLPKTARQAIVSHLTACRFTVGRLGGYGEAMVTRGGVSLKEVNPKTLESKLHQNLYFLGEVLDIDGDTGGFNLQAAFSTAYLASLNIREHLQKSLLPS